MVPPRISLAVGAAAAAGAAFLLAGRIEGTALTVLMLVLAARAAGVSSSSEPPLAQRALARQVALVPAWIGIVAVGLVRAGSVQLADVRGANAVAGLAIARGSVVIVVACWFAVVAGMLSLIAPSGGGAVFAGFAVASTPAAFVEVAAVVLQAALLVTLFAGPQVHGVRDIGPWIVGGAAAAEVLWFGRRIARWDWLPRAATVFAGIGFALILIGGRP